MSSYHKLWNSNYKLYKIDAKVENKQKCSYKGETWSVFPKWTFLNILAALFLYGRLHMVGMYGCLILSICPGN